MELIKSTRKIDCIYLHCSATPTGHPVSLDTIRAWHKARGFKDIGYHYVVQPSGVVEIGRPVYEPGAGVKGDNGSTIHVCMIGEWNGDCMPVPQSTQLQETGRLLAALCKLYGIRPDSYGLLLHREAHKYRIGVPNPHKSCPGMNITGRAMRLFVKSFMGVL